MEVALPVDDSIDFHALFRQNHNLNHNLNQDNHQNNDDDSGLDDGNGNGNDGEDDNVLQRIQRGDLSELTAEMYLSFVRYQANQLPLVSRANVDSSKYQHNETQYMPAIDAIPPCHELSLLPTEEWMRDVLKTFSELRLMINQLEKLENKRMIAVPALKDGQSWLKFCLGPTNGNVREQEQKYLSFPGGVDEDKESRDYREDDEIDGENGEELLRKRKRECASLAGIELDDIVTGTAHDDENADDFVNLDGGNDGQQGLDDQLREKKGEHEEASVSIKQIPSTRHQPTMSLLLQFDQILVHRLIGYHVDYLHDRETFSTEQGEWLYALLAKLDKPLHQDMAASLRLLYRDCCRMRNDLASRNIREVDDDDCESILAGLNTLIAITGSYFNQGEEFVAAVMESGIDAANEGDFEDADEDEYGEGDYSDEEEDEEAVDDLVEDGINDSESRVVGYSSCHQNELEEGEEEETQ